MSLESIKYTNGKLEVLDQLHLPLKTEYINVGGVEDGWHVIHKMQVRGAPAIAIVGCLSLAVELQKEIFVDRKIFRQEVEGKLNYLVSARPTAVNMKLAADQLINLVNELDKDDSISPEEMKQRFIKEIEAMVQKDLDDNRAIGKVGAEALLSHWPDDTQLRVLTHCNTGSLATSGYGTALGVIRYLHSSGQLEHVYCTETRPYNQGARLTAYELVHEKIPATLICDSMVSALMRARRLSGVVVGADRVASNGDTANKIGTYQIAVAAKYHGVPFYVAAPMTSIDFSIPSGEHIVIEERPEKEMTHVGNQCIAAPDFENRPCKKSTKQRYLETQIVRTVRGNEGNEAIVTDSEDEDTLFSLCMCQHVKLQMSALHKAREVSTPQVRISKRKLLHILPKFCPVLPSK